MAYGVIFPFAVSPSPIIKRRETIMHLNALLVLITGHPAAVPAYAPATRGAIGLPIGSKVAVLDQSKENAEKVRPR